MFTTPFTGEDEAEDLRGCTTTKTKPAWTHHIQNLFPLRDPSKVNRCREVWVIHILGSVSQNELCLPRFPFQSKGRSKETFRICLRQLRDSPSTCGGTPETRAPNANLKYATHVCTVATSSRFVLSPTNESSKGRKMALSGRSFVPFSLAS